ncbi:hypothetical protein ACRALDRAFT_1040537 [Sodiomyces alcalophilus JCM 7366]|uniref:uncharacterized protein n=1 Tax=Sodiomyces alcalophilus JCM 7366 TaxID=591952 RepID=UPI0039B4C536
MSQQPLTDDQVGQELRKMTAFIKQEAMEKAREIEIKANEEFAIEKSRLVRQETDAIDASYEKKFKQATMSQQITRSTVANKTRLRILAARQEMVDSIFDTAVQKLSEGTKDKSKYQDILKNLILDGLYALSEPAVQVRVRKADADITKKAIEDAVKEYKKQVGKDTSAVVDKDEYLPEGSGGGAVIVGGNGKIEIDNTFEKRLRLLQETALPAVRDTLFGQNPNRRFYD